MKSFEDFSGRMENMLLSQILPFWLNLKDEEHGGYYGYVNRNGTANPLADKGVILHSRILWTFSEAFRVTNNTKYLDAAEHAYSFLTQKAMDKEYGGLYWMLDNEGKPAELFKHSYNQAFGVYALSNFYLATGKKEALDQAIGLFCLIEEKWRDTTGYLEQLTRTFEPMRNDKLSENGIVAEKTMNSLLHIMEAYTVLYQASHDPDVKSALIFAVKQLTEKMYNPKKERLEVFFDSDLNSLLDLHSYGHDIEASWLIDRAVSAIGDPGLSARTAPVTQTLYDHVMRRAYTKRGVYFECQKGQDNTQRDWWVQAEAVIGVANDFQKNKGEEEHLSRLYELLNFLQSEIIMPSGEWAWTIYEDGTQDMQRELAGPWKCPYHNGRMCMEIMERFGKKKMRGEKMEKFDTTVSEDTSLLLRFAAKEDVDTILQFIRSLAKYENMENDVILTRDSLLDTLFTNKYAEVVIAELRGEPVGFMLFFYNYSTFLGQPGIYLEDLYLISEVRKMGYGKQMLAYLARLAIDRKCGRLEWSCLDWNLPSRRFYEGLGAKSKEEWIGYRLSGPAMQELADKAISL